MTENDIDHLLAGIASRARDLAGDDATEGTTAQVAHRLSSIREAITALREADDLLSDDLAARMEEDEIAITGVGSIRRKARTSSTWIDDSARERMMEDAIRAIIQETCVDPATGEIHGPLAQVARTVWRLTHDSFSVTADPKVAFRRALGLSPDDYRAKRMTGYTISIEHEEIQP
jgi:hypothetical protein